MAKPASRLQHKGRRESGNFLRVPTTVIDSRNFRALSNKAKALILDMGATYNGYNNGDLAATWSDMKSRGWRSKDTLQRATNELLQFGMVELTRQGGLIIGPSLFAFTWMPIEMCGGKLDVPPTKTASGKWKLPPGTVK
jgi:hypothetical protein